MQKIYDLIVRKIDKGQVRLNESMSKHTSFRIGGPADMLIKIGTISELKYVLKVVKENNVPLTVIRKWLKLASKRPEELEE